MRLSYVLPYLVDTELGRGTTTTRPHVQAPAPEDVADAIVDAVRARARRRVAPVARRPAAPACATASPRPVIGARAARPAQVDACSRRRTPTARRVYERPCRALVSEALLVIDVQNDFTPGGALGVPEGDAVVARINDLMASGRFDIVLATRDWHPPDHGSFDAAEPPGPWPRPLRAGDVRRRAATRTSTATGIDRVVDKGQDRDTEGYSAFDETGLAAGAARRRRRRGDRRRARDGLLRAGDRARRPARGLRRRPSRPRARARSTCRPGDGERALDGDPRRRRGRELTGHDRSCAREWGY